MPYTVPTVADGLPHLVDDLEQALDAGTTRIRRRDAPRELLVRSTVPRLLALTAIQWVAIGALWLAMVWLPWWAWPVPVVLVAGRLHALGVILHDLCHLPVRRRGLATALIEVFAGYPLATTVNAMRYHHLRHHRDSGMPADPYFKPGVQDSPVLYAANVLRGLALMPFWTIRPWFGLAAWAFPRLRHPYARVFLQDRSGEDLTHSAEVLRCARAELGQAVVQSFVIAALVVFPFPVLVAYVLPAELAGVLAAWRLLQEHNYTAATDRSIETILATTNDHHLGPLLGRLVLAPLNIGYHVVHHIHPQVGLDHVPALRAWYVEHHRDRYPPPRGLPL